jgi:hypothetical protein
MSNLLALKCFRANLGGGDYKWLDKPCTLAQGAPQYSILCEFDGFSLMPTGKNGSFDTPG